MEKGYSVLQSAELLGVKARTIREWIRTGVLHAQKIEGSRRWVILESEIKRLRHEDAIAEYSE